MAKSNIITFEGTKEEFERLKNSMFKGVEVKFKEKQNLKKNIIEKIDLFFDKKIEDIYQDTYGDSEEPMPFDEIREHLKDFLEKEK